MAAAGDAGRAPRTVADATHDLYRQYGKQIYAYCLHQLRSREEAEDAVQTTFLNAFRGLQRGTTTRFEQAWLYKIAQNVCIARRSSSGRRLKLEAPDDFEILQEIVPSGASAGEGDTLELMGLDEALDSMPENQRRAILLREWQGLSYREIADELGLSQGAVEMLIFRARRTLATALEQPAAAEKRRRGTAKTGFSFGSLIAAMKSLFSTGASLKMAAVVAGAAAVVGTNVVHTVVKPFIPAKQPAHASVTVQQQQTQATLAPPASTPRTSFAGIAKRASHATGALATARLAHSSGGATGRRPVIPETAPAPAGGSTSAPSTSVDTPTAATAAPAQSDPSTAMVTTYPSSPAAPRSAPKKKVAPSAGQHHSGAALPGPVSTGTPGDTTGTPHQHGPQSAGPTSASIGTTSSSDASSGAPADGGPVSIGGGPVGYSSGGGSGNGAGNTPRGGGSTTAGDTSGDSSSTSTTSADTSGDSSSTTSSDSSSSSTDTSSSGDGSGDTGDSGSSGNRGQGNGWGNGHGNGNGEGDGNGNGGGHGNGHHGHRSVQNAG